MTQVPSAVSSKKTKFKPEKLDKTKGNDIKEKLYVTRQIDSSIAILDSPEDDVVLEALLFLSKFSDAHIDTCSFVQQRFLLQKLLNLLNRNVCILRLVLRLLRVLLTVSDVTVELDQDVYDDKILKICHMYISHTDAYVRQFCVSILSQLADTCRITCLIFKTDLFNPILVTIQNTKDIILLDRTFQLFLKLLAAPAALGILPEIYNFDISILLMHLENAEKKIAHLSFEVILKLTYHSLNVFQQMFKEAKLIEKMLEVVMNPEKTEFHKEAFNIICNSMKSEETSNYFIESVEFLKFCQWVKTCGPEYLFPCITILELLTKIPSRRQVLFDLSVEVSILYFLRSTEKNVLNKTCEAICNMTTHKYCCERMLTPVVLRELGYMLLRKDEEDPGNEVALKTIFYFTRRNSNTLDMIHGLGIHKTLLAYFKRVNLPISEDGFLAVLEILYKMSLHPLYQEDIVDTVFYQRLLYLFQTGSTNIATFACEILTNFVTCSEYVQVFLSANGPQIFVGALQTCKDTALLKNVLLFIHSILIHDTVIRSFLQNNLVRVLKSFSENVKSGAPLVDRILKLVYGIHLPLKLFETKKLEIIEKLGNKFYVINGEWKAPFPFLEILDASQMSTFHTIYVVDNTYEVVRIKEVGSSDRLSEKTTSDTMATIAATVSSAAADSQSQSNPSDPYGVHYGKLSSDPHLPKYIFHFNKRLEQVDTLKEKIEMLAEYVDTLLCGQKEEPQLTQKIQVFQEHLRSLKVKFGTNLIPIGYLRMGFHCERALLFKAIADKSNICASLVKGRGKMYWNEVALFNRDCDDGVLKFYVVDLMDNVGNLLLIGSRDANRYCNMTL